MNRRISAEPAGRLVDGAGASSVATDLVRRLRAEDPALLVGWLQSHAVEALAAHVAGGPPLPCGTVPARKPSRHTRQQTEAQAVSVGAGGTATVTKRRDLIGEVPDGGQSARIRPGRAGRRAQARTGDRRPRVALVGCAGRVERMLTVTGLAKVFGMHGSLEDAFAWLDGK